MSVCREIDDRPGYRCPCYMRYEDGVIFCRLHIFNTDDGEEEPDTCPHAEALKAVIADDSLTLRAVGTCETCHFQSRCQLRGAPWYLKFCDGWRKREV
jgi:hypothetical protein